MITVPTRTQRATGRHIQQRIVAGSPCRKAQSGTRLPSFCLSPRPSDVEGVEGGSFRHLIPSDSPRNTESVSPIDAAGPGFRFHIWAQI